MPKSSWIAALSRWYEHQARPLPWRRSHDPYSIWISEIMLQQTQVTTVIPYYERFLKAFPAVADLAAAPEEKVLTLWSGLGYYSRARNLHRGAQTLVGEFKGKFPRDRETVLSIAGIGPYTAGAILSIAFDLPVPLVDGNVERVFSRHFALETPIKARATQQRLWAIASEAVKEARSPRLFNQALMELGALICTKGKPQCGRCPIQASCEGRRRGIAENLPVRTPRRERVDLWWLGLVYEKRGKLLLQQNPEGEWWHGLWDFPHRRLSDQKALLAEERALLENRPEGRPLPQKKHTVTHHRIHLQPVWLPASEKAAKLPTGRWFSKPEIAGLPLSSLARKVVADLLE